MVSDELQVSSWFNVSFFWQLLYSFSTLHKQTVFVRKFILPFSHGICQHSFPIILSV